MIRAGSIVAIFLFDVAEEIDLAAVSRFTSRATSAARLSPKPATPEYIQYQTAPLVIDVDDAEMLDGFRPRIKLFDYGVVSLALSRPFSGTWVQLIAESHALLDNEALEQRAEAMCRRFIAPLGPAMHAPRSTFLSEDYFVFSVTELEARVTADDLLAGYGAELALLLRGERQALSGQEREEVLRHRISYLADDLVIPTWNAAFVYDTEAGAQAALEIFEFANSQLLQFRYYDDLLEGALERIYGGMNRPKWYHVFRQRYTKEVDHLHTLFVEVNELTDKTENALKMIGDLYAARLYALVAARLSLDRWKGNVREKLKTLDVIFDFAVEQIGIARGLFLELTIVLILILELVLILLGIMS
jgi:hypothetical protein